MYKKYKIIPFFLILFFAFASSLYADNDFKIISPAANSRFELPTTIQIRWLNYSYSSKDIRDLRVEIISEDNNYLLAAKTPNDGEYLAKLDKDIAAGTYRVKITNKSKTAIGVGRKFQIIAPIPIDVLSPASDATWYAGDSVQIKWQAPHPDSSVYINLLKVNRNDQLVVTKRIAEGVKNSGSYNWVVPDDVVDGEYIISFRIPEITDIKYSKPFNIETKQPSD
jgi:hypothetical protein